MQLIELTKKEFDHFSQEVEQANFQQSSMWAKFKAKEGWHAYYLGLEEKNELIASTMLLAKENKLLKKRFFYAPRGFLIDYKDWELLEEFTHNVINYVKEKNGVLLKIDPYLLNCERNQKGEKVAGGMNNDFVKEHLKKLGFYQVDNEGQKAIQPCWLYQIFLGGKTLDGLLKEMTPKARQIIRRNERMKFHVRTLEKEEFPIFDRLMDRVSKKYHMIEYNLPFYEELYASFKGHMKIMVVEVSFQQTLQSLMDDIGQLEREKEEKVKSYQTSKMTEDVFIDKVLAIEERKYGLLENIEYFKKMQTKCQTDSVILGGYLYLTYGKEVVALQGAMDETWIKLDGSYSIHYEMIKEALKQGYQRYNFYEIPSDFIKDGSYQFRKNFGGSVVELIGEFDYPIVPLKYNIAKKLFPEYYGVKNIYKK